jgi:hypothetical protein
VTGFRRLLLAGAAVAAGCAPAAADTGTLSGARLAAYETRAAALPLTPGEAALRRQARAVLVPSPEADADVYAAALLGAGYATGAARYGKLMDDIAADGTRIAAFLASADAVVGVTGAAGEAVAGRLARTVRRNENLRLLSRVRSRFAERLDVYRQALGQLVLVEPGREAIAAEEAITDLEWRLRRLPAG